MEKLKKDFYTRPALVCVKDFLGKALVHQTPLGRVSGIVNEVEAYPAFSDEVHHGNKKTPRAEVMWQEGGYAYVYLIYGIWHQFAVVVGKEDMPDVIFIKAAIPFEGIDIMEKQWDKETEFKMLANSPGKLCKSFLITKKHYGVDLTRNELFFKDWNITIPEKLIQTSKRVGISAGRKGFDKPLRFFVKPSLIALPKITN